MVTDRNGERVTAYRCEACGALLDETNGEPLYECGKCGTRFPRSCSADGDSHRCPNCNRFAAKIADDTCIACAEGAVQATECFLDLVTGRYIPVGEADTR